MADVRISPAAQEDLVSIWSYIAQTDECAADRLLDRIVVLFQQLATRAHMGRARPEFGVPNLRSFPQSAYIVYYCPAQRGVDIVRVLHAARDVTAEYFESNKEEES